MKSKRLLSLMLLCFAIFGVARAEVVEIGDGGTTNNQYLPGYNFYNYSWTQQIYTADEIGTAGTINSIAFQNTGAEKTRTYNVYMALTDKATFTDGSDWVAMSDDDLVFAGELTFAVGAWTTITLDTPFAYDGSSNLIVGVADVTGSYSSSPHMACLVFDATSQAIRVYRDSGAYDITAPGETGTVLNVKNQIQLDITAGSGPTCAKPKNLAVEYTGGTTATVTWTGDATQYNIDVNGTVTNNVTSPYTLTGLDLATVYEVKMQANCGGGDLSDWTSPKSFTTDLCMPEDMCEITFELTDSYGDGWNGNAIKVVDALTGAEVGSVTISSGSSYTGTIAVCDGRAINFVWVAGSYASETSYVVYDINGEEIFSGSAGNGLIENYTVSCAVSSCRKPTNLTVTDIFGRSAKLSWTENGEARAWNIKVNGELIENVDNPYTLTGLTPETAYTVQVSPVCEDEKWSDEITFTTTVACPAPTFEVDAAAESATINIAGEAETYNVRYRTLRGFNYGFEQAEAWTITDFDPCTVYDGDGVATYGFSSWTFTNSGYTGACIAFNNDNEGGGNMASHSGNAFGVMFNATSGASNDWFILPELAIERGYVFSFWGREITNQYGDEIINVGIYGSTDGTFASILADSVAVSTTEYTKFEYDLSEYAGQTIRLAINCVSNDVFGFMFDDIFVGNPEDDTWDYVYTEVTSPYEITGLTELTEYEVQAQANCGEDGVSDWSASMVFMTLPLCEAPTNVLVADITTNSAVVTWESEATSFDIEVNGEVTEDVTSPYTLNNLDPGTVYSVRVRANCGETGYSAWTTAVSFVTSCFAYELPYEYGFETADDLNCWSMMAANSGNSFGRINLTDAAIQNYAAYDGDYAFIFSSYNSADAYDQVLISPELNSGDAKVAFEFYYRVYGSGTESLYVLYSTTTNDLDSFEVADTIEATNTEEWLQYQTTLPAGTKYVALYYNSNYQYYLFVDGFKFEEAVGVTQTIELTAGWNWFSTYVELEDPVELLNRLQEGLGDTGIQIENVIDGVNMNVGDGYWAGDLDGTGLLNEPMYMIEVSEDITVELQGPATNPESHGITLYPGDFSWIGFPCAEEVDVNVALAGLEPEEGDYIENDVLGVIYYYGEWVGDFDTMIPGRGYMYYSNSTDEKTLIFQTGEVKAKHSANPASSQSLNSIKASIKHFMDKASKQSKINSATISQKKYIKQSNFLLKK